MARDLQGYSRLVFWLKIALPILALAILSTLFLFARRIDFEGALPYAEVDIEALANDPRLARPAFSTVTAAGDAIRIAAATARPGRAEGDPMSAEDIVAVYDLTSGRQITLQARTGTLDAPAGVLVLKGEVTMSTSDGYVLSAPEMTGLLGGIDFAAEGGVAGTAPFGTITAGRMTIGGPPGAPEMVFKGAVRLIYEPKD